MAALAGCSSETEPIASSVNGTAATPATTSAAPVTTAPAPIADDATIRRLCNTIADLGNSNNFDPDANLAAGQRGELIVDPKFSLPGRGLVTAAGAASAAPGPDTNIDIAQAQLDFLDACGDKYGDGPW
ncbi:hypothetical protein GA0070624_3457 [Micromonospora rhizosphaerae]|uniref:Uncharacterized protein n=1 Tax=Micromonospora rhizosphaerae TaxID=568872 RepID=A0A1C6SCJ7_9ACTN|nr:hypothetical protein GA0070624_3457 [Micromonospora rhizosphaerae]